MSMEGRGPVPSPRGYEQTGCSVQSFFVSIRAGIGRQFHLEACRELLRICRPGGEVRIYPLLDLSFKGYLGLDTLIQELEDSGASVRMMESRLAFIPGSKDLLCLTKKDR